MNKRVNTSLIIQNQLPEFVETDFPLIGEFLKQYYVSQTVQSGPVDILENIDQYLKIDNLAGITTTTTLSNNISSVDTTIDVSSTQGFPEHYGLLQIDDEIISYTDKTSTSFLNCYRGFSGIESYETPNSPDDLLFSSTEEDDHVSGSIVDNLSTKFLTQFLLKLKKQISPGFDNRILADGLDQNIFLKQVKDFYSTKGTDESFEILFRALYGKDVEVLKPRERMIIPSNADWRNTRDIVVEPIIGDIEKLTNLTIFQDETTFQNSASGTINNIEPIRRGEKDYYVLNLDLTSVLGTFSIHPKTKIITDIGIGANTIDVDSTLGFPSSGTLIVQFANGTTSSVEYTNKTVNQFLGCTGLDQNTVAGQELYLDTYAYGYTLPNNQGQVRFRITGVLSKLDILENTIEYGKSDLISVKNLGLKADETNIRANEWIYNISNSYDIKEISLVDVGQYIYEITTYNKHGFSLGSAALLKSSTGLEYNVLVTSIVDEFKVEIKGSGSLDISFSYKIEKLLNKVNCLNFPEINKYTSDVQNVYLNDEEVYVASNSLPNYLSTPLGIQDYAITFSGSFIETEELVIGNHGFYTGDIVSYTPSSSTDTLGIPTGIPYFVKVVNPLTVKLAYSRANISTGNFITFNAIVSDSKLQLEKFNNRDIDAQKLIRKIVPAVSNNVKEETKPGSLGVLVNGVQILNYKSRDTLFYGDITKSIVAAPGDGYDVINPPVVYVNDSVGTGATIRANVIGNLKRINLIEQGFNYTEIPSISISGGNGVGAVAEANLLPYTYKASFNASDVLGAGLTVPNVDLINSVIGFSTFHKFENAERVFYRTFDQKSIIGLSTDAEYYVKVHNPLDVSLYKTEKDAIDGTNRVGLASTAPNGEVVGLSTIAISWGVGNHALESFDQKQKVSSIRILDSGSDYKNRRISAQPTGIITSLNNVKIVDHGFESGETIRYSCPTGTSIEGLVVDTDYLVTSLDEDNFKLSPIGLGTTGSSYFYDTKQYIDLNSVGVSTQVFSDPPINVIISGTVGLTTIFVGSASTNNVAYGDTTFYPKDFKAIIQPIFRGHLQSSFIENGGVGYGSSDIINFYRDPQIFIRSGEGAQFIPVISSEGEVIDVLVQNTGREYNTPPLLTVEGQGSGAVLTPVLSSGKIIEVKIISGGSGYFSNDTSIEVTSAGSEGKVEVEFRKWTVNITERLFATEKITDDDGVISTTLETSDTLQYNHLYAPRRLRELVQGSKVVGGKKEFEPDLKKSFTGSEVASVFHSPIIGWAYDGNPIYGPYGYSTSEGGTIKLMESGYKTVSKTNRPSVDTYPVGSFVEDHEYSGIGDLDEYNGRFAKTPEFPKGVYAYYTTISESNESSGPFLGFRKPVFPYFIGNKFKSTIIDYNYLPTSNQDSTNINESGWFRNTRPYELDSNTSSYNFLLNPNSIQKQFTEVKSVTRGSLDGFDIVNSGDNYKIDDKIRLDYEQSGGFKSRSVVSELKGKEITNISVASTSFESVEFIPIGNSRYLGIATVPHGLYNGEIITVAGLSTTKTDLLNSFSVGITSSTYPLTQELRNVAVTGVTTYVSVNGNLSSPSLMENDILGISSDGVNTERVKVLEIDRDNSQIKILREIDGTVSGLACSASDKFYQVSRKLEFDGSYANLEKSQLNKEYYFDPKDTVALGTTHGVGLSSSFVVGLTTYTTPGWIGTGTTTIIAFQDTRIKPNWNRLSGKQKRKLRNKGRSEWRKYSYRNYNDGGYVSISSARNASGIESSSFYGTFPIVSIAATTISIAFDSSALQGIGATVYLDKPVIAKSPYRSIHLPDNDLNDGDALIYNSNGGGNIAVSTDGTTNNNLEDGSILYATVIEPNFIGLSSSRVAINTGGSYVGLGTTSNLLYFTGIGTGSYHSLKTNYSKVVKGILSKNTVTVSTATTHGLSLDDTIDLDVKPGVSTDVVVKYNDQNRRLVINPRTFLASEVSILDNTIRIINHKYSTGQKVIYTSSTPSGGLIHNEIYYVVVVDKNRFNLSKTHYNSLLQTPIIINITSASGGTISPINPSLDLTRNNKIVFNLSDSSLSYPVSYGSTNAFNFRLFTDSKFLDEFDSTTTTGTFEVKSIGIPGVDSSATLELSVNANIKYPLYYNIVPVDTSTDSPLNDVIKTYVTDTEEIVENNKLFFVESEYSGIHKISGIGTTTFSYTIEETPEVTTYLSDTNFATGITTTNAAFANYNYTTKSLSADGAVSKVNIQSKGSSFKTLPAFISIASSIGKDALLRPKTTTIGNIDKFEIRNIGFDYSADKTIAPSGSIPASIRLDRANILDKVGISSAGLNYTLAPKLVLVDPITNIVDPDADLKYEIGDTQVKILKNTKGLFSVSPRIIPTQNSNGVGISSLTYNDNTKDVRLYTNVGYSVAIDWPFIVGDKILLENISVGVGSTGVGFNSKNYGYQLFEITSMDENIGGNNGSVVINLSKHLKEGEYPGNFNKDGSAGLATPERLFPIFDTTLKKYNFLVDEIITSEDKSGKVLKWTSLGELLKLETNDDFKEGDLIIGESSGAQGKIITSEQPKSHFEVDSSSVVNNGWKVESGFLNNELQRISDNDYYQNLSYSIKSEISYDKWDDAVTVLNHPVGFRKFSDLIVQCFDASSVGIGTTQDQGLFSIQVDMISDVNLNCEYDFDLVKENSFEIEGELGSDLVTFQKIIQDYSESRGNRALVIDDISGEFNSDPRSTPYSAVDIFSLTDARVRKYITYARDKRYTDERQILLVTLLHDYKEGRTTFGYLNQYGRVDTEVPLGSFDFSVSGADGYLDWYPVKFKRNDYSVSAISYDLKGTATGVGSTAFGDSVVAITSSITLPTSMTSMAGIVTIPKTFNASKVILEFNATDDSFYEFQELNYVYNSFNGELELLDYGNLTAESKVAKAGVGLGTYGARVSSDKVIVEFTPHSALSTSFVCNSMILSFDESKTGVSSVTFDTTDVSSKVTSIGATEKAGEVPGIHTVSTYNLTDYGSSYCMVSVSAGGTMHQMSEVAVASTAGRVDLTEYGIIFSDMGLGTVGANIKGTDVELTFRPIAGIACTVQVYQNSIGVANEDIITTEIPFTNGKIQTNSGNYSGTERDIKRDFNIFTKENPVFEKEFNSAESTIVNLTDNTIIVPNHFFVSGEQLEYSYGRLDSPIGIVTATIAGFGSTDKLPTKVFAVKDGDLKIKLAASAENALKENPTVLDLNALGVGTQHSFISTEGRGKMLITVDNVIQSPLVQTGIAYTLTNPVVRADNSIDVSGITSVFVGDILNIDQEYLLVEQVGVAGANRIVVQRGWMDTTIGIHPGNSTVTKFTGSYNVRGNTLSFVEAPKGLSPISTTTGDPDNRDWTGISTHATFSGRTFTRSGVTGTAVTAYNGNYIFDNISEQFNGISTQFALKNQGNNLTSISDQNALILNNAIAQQPARFGGVRPIIGDYELSQVGAATTIGYTGIAVSQAYDPNNSSIPIGGVIVSVSSTEGFAYQPLVSAGGTAIVSGLGTVSSVSIGNSGSGYRTGILTTGGVSGHKVNVSVSQASLGISTVVAIGTALQSDGYITGIAITASSGTGYTAYISNYKNPQTSLLAPVIATPVVTGFSTISIANTTGIKFSSDVPSSETVVSIVGAAATNLGVIGIGTFPINTVAGSGVGTDKIFVTTSLWPTGVDTSKSKIKINNKDYSIVSTAATYLGLGSTISSSVGVGSTLIGIDTRIITLASGVVGGASSGSSVIIKKYEPPVVSIDAPLSYSNVPLVYAANIGHGSESGIGTGAKVDVVVGSGSSVVDFRVRDVGYGYQYGDVLTVEVGGNIGIPTCNEQPSKFGQSLGDPGITTNFRPFTLTVDSLEQDEFSGWAFGQLEVLDSLDNKFDGKLRTFTLTLNNEEKSIAAAPGSSVDVEASLIVFINNILQAPGGNYTFPGGTRITFSEPPKKGDTSKIWFYKGTSSVDVVDIDILETVKKGDDIKINSTQLDQKEDKRLVNRITSPTDAKTNSYFGPGVSDDEELKRPVDWCRQTEDKIIDNIPVPKDRPLYEPSIFPTTNLIKSLETSDTIASVENVRTVFDSTNEDASSTIERSIEILSQDIITGAAATAIVSVAGTVVGIVTSEIGKGYSSAPSVTISSPVGLGSTQRATVTATVSAAGTVTGYTITSPGTGYSTYSTEEGKWITQPPLVLIEEPSPTYEKVNNVLYSGDFGVITGIAVTQNIDGVGVGSTSLVLDLHIPMDSYLRDASITGTAITMSSIAAGYYFVLNNTNVGNGITAVSYPTGATVGVATQFLDGIYEAANVSIAQTDLARIDPSVGSGLTSIVRVKVGVSTLNGLTGIGTGDMGDYSWGRVDMSSRGTSSNTFEIYNTKGMAGINTSPILRRVNPLKSSQYLT